MDHYSDSPNDFLSINIKSTAAKGGRVTGQMKMNQRFLLQLNGTVSEEKNERKLCGHLAAPSMLMLVYVPYISYVFTEIKKIMQKGEK